MSDVVNHPAHYNAHPGGIECIELVEQLPFCQGNAIKYLWRANHKGAAVQDLSKALWYVERAFDSASALVFSDDAPDTELDPFEKLLERACAGFSDRVATAIRAIAHGDLAIAGIAIRSLLATAEKKEGV